MGQSNSVTTKYTNKKAALKAVKQNGEALQDASDRLRGDKEVVLEAVRQKGSSLQYASEALRASEDVVLAAVKEDGLSLMHASRDLRSNKHIVLEAVKQRAQSLQLASDTLRGDPEVVLAAARQMGHTLKYASAALRADRDFVLEVVRANAEAFEHVSEDLCGDREIVLEAVQRWGSGLRFASLELKADQEVVWAAVKQSGRALRFASDRFRADQDLLLLVSRTTSTPKDIVNKYLDAGYFERKKFWGAADSRIASPGESGAPALSICLSRAFGGCGREGEHFRCEVSLMSGASFSLHIPIPHNSDGQATLGANRPGPNVGDLAALLVEELPQKTEVKRVERVFVSFVLDDDGRAELATPWDWPRLLFDYLWLGNEGL